MLLVLVAQTDAGDDTGAAAKPRSATLMNEERRTGALQRAGAHLCAWGRRPQSPTQRWLQSCCVRVLLPGSKLDGADADAVADGAAAEFLGLLRR